MKGLGPTQRKVASLICEGKKAEEIAALLHLELGTVKDHYFRLYRKFGITGGIPHIKLAARLMYKKHPELIPFARGIDRASVLGQTSATVFAAIKEVVHEGALIHGRPKRKGAQVRPRERLTDSYNADCRFDEAGHQQPTTGTELS